MEKKVLRSKIYTAIDETVYLNNLDRKQLVEQIIRLVDAYTVTQVNKVVKSKLTK